MTQSGQTPSAASPTGGPAGPQAPPVSDEQAREYLAQLRTAPAEQLVSELLSGLLNAAQVKLGRRDARLLIDLSALMIDHARPHLPAELGRQVDQVLGQLRLAQVRAEEAAAGRLEPNDLAESPRPPAPAGSGPAGGGPAAPPNPAASGPPAASRLWLPGRDF